MQEKTLTSVDLYVDGQDFWFTDIDRNALYRMKKDIWQPELIGVFPGESFWQERLYSAMTMCGGKLYFAPYFAREIAEYNPENRGFRKIPVDILHKNKYITCDKTKFTRIVSIKEKIYFIPDFYPGILCYDTQTNSCYCFDEWIEEIEKIRTSAWGYFIEFVLIGEKLILPCACANAIVIFDTNTKMSQVIRTEATKHECKFCGICYVNQYFYILSAEGIIYKRKLEAEDEKIQMIQLPTSDSLIGEFHPAVYMNGYIYLFPFEKNRGFRLHVESGCVESLVMFDDEKNYEGPEGLFHTGVVQNDKLYAFTAHSRRFVIYDVERKEKQAYDLRAQEKDWQILEEYRRKDFLRRMDKEYIIENENESLQYMCSMLYEKRE